MAIQPSTPPRSSLSGSTTTIQTDEVVWTLEEAAAYLRCHAMTIKRNAKILHIPHKRLGSLWRFSGPALKAWMQNRDLSEREGKEEKRNAA
jgi:excisionase family DNA binding protein